MCVLLCFRNTNQSLLDADVYDLFLLLLVSCPLVSADSICDLLGPPVLRLRFVFLLNGQFTQRKEDAGRMSLCDQRDS